jgi:hypothetical protein
MACCTAKPGHSSYCQDRIWKDTGIPNSGFYTFEEMPQQSDVGSYSVGFGPYTWACFTNTRRSSQVWSII